VRVLLGRLELPVKPPPLEAGQIKAIMQADKKVLRGRLRFVLLEAAGSPVISDQVTEAMLDQLLADYFA